MLLGCAHWILQSWILLGDRNKLRVVALSDAKLLVISGLSRLKQRFSRPGRLNKGKGCKFTLPLTYGAEFGKFLLAAYTATSISPIASGNNERFGTDVEKGQFEYHDR